MTKHCLKRTKLTKLVKSTLAVFAIVLMAAGCSKDDDGANLNYRGGAAPRGSGSTSPTSSAKTLDGVVYTDPQWQDDFTLAVRDFLSASLDPELVGYVDAQASDGTGVFFGGSVELRSDSLSQSNQSSAEITANSTLNIQVIDRWEGQSNLPAIPPISLVQSSGYIDMNGADLKFWDQYGEVYLNGSFQGDDFVGTFEYRNHMTYNGQPPAYSSIGTLGSFRIPTCRLFRCN